MRSFWAFCLVVIPSLARGGEAELFPVVQGGKWGYIDKAGKVAIPPRFDCAWDFSEGLARVQVGLYRGFIDPAGKMVVEPQYFLAWDFHEGLAAVNVNTGAFGNTRVRGNWGYIDKSGKMVIPASEVSKWAEDFHEGFARFRSYGNCFIDKTGRNRLEWPRAFGDFSEGLGAVSMDGRKWGYVDTSMKFAIPAQFEAAGKFADGLAPVKLGGKWGYVDKAGKVAIEPQFEDARPFSDGLAGVAVGGKWGCVGTDGKLAIPPQFEFVAPFSEGLARVVVAGKHGFIDRTGKAAIEPRFDLAWEFSRGLARVEVSGKPGYIDRSGAVVWKPTN